MSPTKAGSSSRRWLRPRIGINRRPKEEHCAFSDSEALSIVILSVLAKNLGPPLKLAVSDYYVYIMTNRKRTLYVGVTNDLIRRVSKLRMTVQNTSSSVVPFVF